MWRWNGGFYLAVEFTSFLCFIGEMVEPVETAEQVEVEETSGADEGLHLINTVTDLSLS